MQTRTPKVSAVVLLLLLSLSFLTSSQAQGATKPFGALILDTIGYADFGGGTWVARYNITFQIPSDDPNQLTTPAFGYSLCGGTNNTGSPNGFLCTSLNGTLTPIPNHAGWVWTTAASATTDACASGQNCQNYPPTFTYNLTAWNGTAPTKSCSLTVDLSTVYSGVNLPADVGGIESTPNPYYPRGDPDYADGPDQFHACGANATLQPPAGINGIVTTPYSTTPGQGSLTNAQFSLSPSDSNNTIGRLDYYAFHRYTDPPAGQTCRTQNGTTIQTCTPGLVYGGVLIQTRDGLGNGTFTITGYDTPGLVNNLYLEAMARDNQTHQRSSMSCTAVLTEGVQYSTGACGNLTAPLTSTTTIGPYFPALNVGAWSARVGISNFNGGLILGAALLFAIILGSFLVAGRIGAIIGGTLGYLLTFALGLWPWWLLILTFGGLVLLIITKGKAANA